VSIFWDFIPAIIAFIITAAFVYFVSIHYKRLLHAPLYTVLRVKCTLDIFDKEGKEAKLIKLIKLRANHKGLTEYVHRNLSADGELGDIQVEINGVKSSFTPEKDAGDTLVHVRFPGPLSRGEKVETSLAVALKNSFCAETEWITYLLTHPTNELIIEICLPEGRPCTATKASCLRGGEIENVHPPKMLDNGRRIVWTSKNLNELGLEYRVGWTWPPVPTTPRQGA